MFGPEFLRKDGEFLKQQPMYENHPAWEPFEKWLEGIKGAFEAADVEVDINDLEWDRDHADVWDDPNAND